MAAPASRHAFPGPEPQSPPPSLQLHATISSSASSSHRHDRCSIRTVLPSSSSYSLSRTLTEPRRRWLDPRAPSSVEQDEVAPSITSSSPRRSPPLAPVVLGEEDGHLPKPSCLPCRKRRPRHQPHPLPSSPSS
ncbi:hypothetical protein PR202_gb16947 [Eleusine coracana subsp. coracana]|uniref:Uncharacterized protein n=1 Tax=Eleusine coracana subsp. coracana TaxID=191504 RepID=A0AAV5EZE2_ELECO|nr:hypothetical protein PR202_gb16947 [Eleusine coracana subsp. coracana]